MVTVAVPSPFEMLDVNSFAISRYEIVVNVTNVGTLDSTITEIFVNNEPLNLVSGGSSNPELPITIKAEVAPTLHKIVLVFDCTLLATSYNITIYTLSGKDYQTEVDTLPPVPDEGKIDLESGVFTYVRLQVFEEGASVTFRNVTFYNIPLEVTITRCSDYFIRVSFPDGVEEKIDMWLCKPSLYSSVFTYHSGPKAGVIVALSKYGEDNKIVYSIIEEGFYFLVG
jgi:hypothetical protein